VDQTPWYERSENKRLINELRERIGEETNVLIFLGAGLSYGVDRGRAAFEVYEYEDNRRFPSWRQLIRRMLARLQMLPEMEGHQDALHRFFAEQGPLDCAELFRSRIGEANYVLFLREQFGSMRNDLDRLTRSHEELVRLPVQRVFTTNYDELIELAYRLSGQDLRVSSTVEEFHPHEVESPPRHLIKLNGSIDRPDTVVLTRNDFARSRRDRAELLAYLGQRLRYQTFLFIGFSLTDPNFIMLHDEARMVMGGAMPASYIVQGRPDVLRDGYLRSLGMNTISLDWWEDLPQFFQRINTRPRPPDE
jgi:SIR2-like domain